MKSSARVAFIIAMLTTSLGAVAANGFPPTPVNVVAAKNSDIYPVSWVSGSVISNNDAQIAVETTGRLVFVAEVGERVSKGQIMARLDDSAYLLQIEELEAAVASAKRNHQYLIDEVTRKKNLTKQNLSAQTDLDNTVNQRDIAKANLAQQQSKLAQAKLRLNYTKLLAPFDGVVTHRLSNLGEVVSSGSKVIQLVETVNLEISAQVPLTVYPFLIVGSSLNVKSPLGDLSATVKAIVPVADTRSHLMELRLSLPANNWPVGLDVRVAVPSGKVANLLVVPRDAVVLRREGNAVFRINAENKAERMPVTLGVASGDLIAIQGEVKAGDNIVIRGAERLQPGQEVAIKENNDTLVSLQQK